MPPLRQWGYPRSTPDDEQVRASRVGSMMKLKKPSATGRVCSRTGAGGVFLVHAAAGVSGKVIINEPRNEKAVEIP